MSTQRRGRIIAIDGPAGAGKSTVARRLAHRLAGTLLDTGAIYRALALVAHRRGFAWDDEPALVRLAADFPLAFQPGSSDADPQRVTFAGDEVTHDIRTPAISDGASRVSALPGVRLALLGMQRAIAASAVEGGRACVAEGRDMGTVVFPDADFKFFLTASADARARRRFQELTAKGVGTTLAAVLEEMRERDSRDSSRASAPLQRAADATVVDSSELDANAVLDLLLAAIAAGEAASGRANSGA